VANSFPTFSGAGVDNTICPPLSLYTFTAKTGGDSFSPFGSITEGILLYLFLSGVGRRLFPSSLSLFADLNAFPPDQQLY